MREFRLSVLTDIKREHVNQTSGLLKDAVRSVSCSFDIFFSSRLTLALAAVDYDGAGNGVGITNSTK